MNPLVSCVMPTRGRQEMARQAVEVFNAQMYEPKELVILDDSEALSFPDVTKIDAGRYIYRRHAGGNIAQKRNILTGMANGEYIMNLDSDDWSAPERLAFQLEQILESGKAVTGFNTMYFYDVAAGRASLFHRVAAPYALGTSLFFRRDWALAHPFHEPKLTGSDNEFVRDAIKAKQIHSVPGVGMMVARHHADCTNARRRVLPYGEVDIAKLPEGFLQMAGIELVKA